MLIAEDLLLLLTDDRSGKLAAGSLQVDIALGGALLVEFALADRVDVAGRAEEVHEGRIVVRDASPTSDTLLDEALATLGKKQGKKPQDVVRALGKGVRARLYARLAEGGFLHEERGTILGVLPTHRWPADDAAHEEAVRTSLAAALRTGATDDPRTAALVALLHALRVVGKAMPAETAGMTRKELKANAERIAAGDWASEAVRKAIAALMAALIAATSSARVPIGI